VAEWRVVSEARAICEARYGFTRRLVAPWVGCAAFMLLALFPMPWPIAVLDVTAFGFFLARSVCLVLGRRVAFRVDSAGVTLGGTPPFYRRSTAFIPWSEIKYLRLYGRPAGSQEARYISVARKHGSPLLPSGSGYWRLNYRVLDDLTVHRQIQSWKLDVTQLQEALSVVAPSVELRGNPPESVAMQVSVRDTMIDDRLRFLWRYLVPVLAVGILLIAAQQLWLSWTANLGEGRPGTWTITEVRCDHRSGCTRFGDYVSGDGSVRRTHVRMFGGAAGAGHIGLQAYAVDIGDPEGVYPIGGGREWWEMTALAAVTLSVLGLWAWTVPISSLRRRRTRDAGSTR